ncbi:MAG TPA: hypothetical protein VFZ44_05585 [Pyrinomonadaceae bacterium]
MSGGKCERCGLVNWPDAAACGRCGATLAAAGGGGAAGEGRLGWRRTSTGWQVARSVMWAVIVYAGLVSLSLLLTRLYDRATGAPPPPGGPPHSPPANPFFYVAVLVIYSAPLTCPVIAALLFRRFRRREDGRRATE